MARVIKSIISDLRNSLKSETNILSMTLVGSFSNLDKPLEKFNDLDIAIICKKISGPFLQRLKNTANGLSEKYSTNKIGFTQTFKIGPIKILSKKQKTIMFHFLIYTKDGYKKYESALTRYSFQHYKPILGLPLSKLVYIPFIHKKDLFNEVDGIPAMKQWILKKEIYYLEPTASGFKLIKSRLSKNLYSEVICYSVLRLASNILRTGGVYAETDSKMCVEFEKRISIRSNKVPSEILTFKKKLRRGKTFTTKEKKVLKNRAVEFIFDCEKLLKS